MNGHPLPWLAPCCAGCAQARRPAAAGATGDTPAPSVDPGKAGGASLLLLGLLFVGVLYGEKILSKLGG